MLLRKLNQSSGLCNGTCLIITKLGHVMIKVAIMTGSGIGQIVYLPRITLTTGNTKFPFRLQRRQFPIRLSYALTINKSQGQTFTRVGVYLKTPAFTHDQLYVVVSRVTSRKGLKTLIENDDESCGFRTKNIVYHEIL